MSELQNRALSLLRKLSGGVAIQIVLSASNFLVGMLLIRRTSNAQYGYYVLVTTTIALSTGLQGAFIQPPMVIRLTKSDATARSDLIGGLYRGQNRLVPVIIIPALVLTLILYLIGHLTLDLVAVVAAGAAAVMCALRREFFRLVMFAYRLPNLVLKADLAYCVLLVAGAALATLTSESAAVAAATLALASLVGQLLLSRAMWRHEPWNPNAPGALGEIFHQGAYSALGAGVHWAFSQGYSYLVAGTLNVAAVAQLAGTKLPVAPVGLLSNGMGTLMLPTVSAWNNNHRATTVLKRLMLFAGALVGATCVYLAIMWQARDWIFANVMKKHFDQGDELLFLWCVASAVTVLRDQLLHFLLARARFQITLGITVASAIVSLTTSFMTMRYIGVVGALIGIVAGEVLHVMGIIVFSMREARRSSMSPAMASETA